MGQLVLVQTYLDRMSAENAKNALEAEGIAAMLSSDDASGMRPELTMTRGVKLWVKEEDGEEARKFLQEAERQNDHLSDKDSELIPEDKPQGFLTKLRSWLSG